jgi:Tfp pilus assembly protein PilO
MKKISLQFLWTERMQVVFILLFVLISLFLTIQFVVFPQRELSENNRAVREQLESSRYASLSLSNMQSIANHESANLLSLSNEWSRIAERLTSFPNQKAEEHTVVNRIDYKVQLYEIRQRLQTKSDELKIQLMPTELGLDETVASGDAIRVRMLQLKAVEKLADLTLDRQIQRLVEIYPLSPVTHKDKKGRKIFEEYPVRLECDVDFEHLFTFFQSVFEENQVFTFRNLRIESGPTFESKLRVKAILSALLFE